MLLSGFSFIAQQITNGCIIPAGFCVDILEWGGLWGVYSSLGRSKHFWEVIKGDIALNQQALMSAELKEHTGVYSATVCLCVLPSHGQPYSSTLMQTVVDSLVTGISLM